MILLKLLIIFLQKCNNPISPEKKKKRKSPDIKIKHISVLNFDLLDIVNDVVDRELTFWDEFSLFVWKFLKVWGFENSSKGCISITLIYIHIIYVVSI